jgi:hypothetical protein
MRKLGVLLPVLMAVSLLLVACQKESSVIEPQQLSAPSLSASYQLPPEATLQSATLSVFVIDPSPSNQTVNVHRITQPWDEMTVTWNSFGASYDVATGSFVPSAPGWQSTDVTALVQQWLNGTYPNYGVLLEQYGVASRYASSENPTPSNGPKLEVCYTVNGASVCETIQRSVLGEVFDAYIWPFHPDVNYGGEPDLYAGLVGEMSKMSLITFDLAPNPQPHGCSLTIGYWKTHGGFGPQPDYVSQYLPIWLGTASGSQSINVNTGLIANNILSMSTYGTSSNGITKLYAQMLGAKLSIANGADGSAIAATISAADAWLAIHSWTEWSSLSKSTQKQVLGWMTTFDNYNNGLIGPGHCD